MKLSSLECVMRFCSVEMNVIHTNVVHNFQTVTREHYSPSYWKANVIIALLFF